MKQYREAKTSILLTPEESESLLKGMKSTAICAKQVTSKTSANNLGALSQKDIDRLKLIVPYHRGKTVHELSGNRKNSGR